MSEIPPSLADALRDRYRLERELGRDGMGAPRLLVRFDDPARQWHRLRFAAHGGRFYFTVGDEQSDI